MIQMEPCRVESAVGDLGCDQLGQGGHTPRFHLVRIFHHNTDCTHATNHPVTAHVKRQGSFGHVALIGRGAGGQKSGNQPLGQVLIGDVIGSDNKHSFAATRSDPVFRQGQAKRG